MSDQTCAPGDDERSRIILAHEMATPNQQKSMYNMITFLLGQNTPSV